MLDVRTCDGLCMLVEVVCASAQHMSNFCALLLEDQRSSLCEEQACGLFSEQSEHAVSATALTEARHPVVWRALRPDRLFAMRLCASTMPCQHRGAALLTSCCFGGIDPPPKQQLVWPWCVLRDSATLNLLKQAAVR